MNEKRLKKRLEFQENIISKQSEQIECLKLEIKDLILECEKKDEIINSVDFLRKELSENIDDIRQKRVEIKKLIQELKTMKNIVNEEVYKKRYWLIKLLLR